MFIRKLGNKHLHVSFSRFEVIFFFLQILNRAKPLPYNSKSFSSKFFPPVGRTQSASKLFVSEFVVEETTSIVKKMFIHKICHLVQKPCDMLEFFVLLSEDPAWKSTNDVFGSIL